MPEISPARVGWLDWTRRTSFSPRIFWVTTDANTVTFNMSWPCIRTGLGFWMDAGLSTLKCRGLRTPATPATFLTPWVRHGLEAEVRMWRAKGCYIGDLIGWLDSWVSQWSEGAQWWFRCCVWGDHTTYIETDEVWPWPQACEVVHFQAEAEEELAWSYLMMLLLPMRVDYSITSGPHTLHCLHLVLGEESLGLLLCAMALFSGLTITILPFVVMMAWLASSGDIKQVKPKPLLQPASFMSLTRVIVPKWENPLPSHLSSISSSTFFT